MQTTYEVLKRKLDEAFDEIRRNRLPGWEAVFFSEKVHPWMMEKEQELFRAFEDEAEIRFTKSLRDVRAGWRRINQRIAEKYRADNPDPTTWELRYLRHMAVEFIRCESPSGEFYITPRPRRTKPGLRAISVDELEEILDTPLLKKAFETFGGVPVDKSEFKFPPKGENHLHFYAGMERPFRTIFSEEDFGGRKSFRRLPFPDDPEGF